MRRVRLLFSKKGKAKYLSHLDLMRTFQRVFLRAGLALRHTEGFNPHPYMNFALPLSLGIESVCELVDFDLTDHTELTLLPEIINKRMPEGIEALKAYEPEKKFTEIKWQEVEGLFVYDKGIKERAAEDLMGLFGKKELIISKKSKKGYADTDIAPLVHHISMINKSREELTIHCVLAAQNPSLNPENLITAIHTHLPEYAPDFASFRREDVYDVNHRRFR